MTIFPTAPFYVLVEKGRHLRKICPQPYAPQYQPVKQTGNITIQEQNKTINTDQQNHRTNTPDIFHIQWISQCLEYHMPCFLFYYT